MGVAEEIEKYLKANGEPGTAATVSRLLSGVDLLVFGETHVNLEIKAKFFAGLIRQVKSSRLFRYHASEHFINDTLTDGIEIEEFLEKKRAASGLSPKLRVHSPILEAIRESLPGFGVVFAGTKAPGQRDRRIHDHFTSSRKLHLAAGRFDSRAKGIFHVGADHSGRVPGEGGEQTTCGRLIADVP